MKNTIIASSFLILIFLGTHTALAGILSNSSVRGRSLSPFLYGPCTENIRLEHENSLEFSWKPVNTVSTIGFELKIYKGFKSLKENLLLSKFIPGPVRAVPIPAGQFQSGETYSWELTQIYFGGEKSKRSFCSFEIK